MIKINLLFLVFCGLLLCSSGYTQIDMKLHVGSQLSNYWNNAEVNANNESFFTGFSADARLAFLAKKRIQLGTGIGINQKGWLVGKKSLGDSEISQGEKIIAKYSGYSYYLELPFQANLFLQQPCYGFYLLASIRPSYRLSNRTKTFFKDGSIRKEKNQLSNGRKFNLLARAGIGYEIPFSKFGLSLSTYFEHQLIDNAAILKELKAYYYSIGILLGIRI